MLSMFKKTSFVFPTVMYASFSDVFPRGVNYKNRHAKRSCILEEFKSSELLLNSNECVIKNITENFSNDALRPFVNRNGEQKKRTRFSKIFINMLNVNPDVDHYVDSRIIQGMHTNRFIHIFNFLPSRRSRSFKYQFSIQQYTDYVCHVVSWPVSTNINTIRKIH